MSTITKEWLQQKIADMEAVRDDIPFGLDEDESNTLAALRIALASIEAKPVSVNDDMAYAFHHAISDSSLGSDEVEEIKAGLRAAFANVTATPSPVSVPDYPETLPCPVMLEPGLRFGNGVPTRTMLGALQRRAEYYAELEAMTPEQRAEHDANMKEFAAMLQAGNHTEQHLDMVVHSGDDNEKADCRLPFDQWLSQQNEPIDVDCGCVTTEAFYHWLRVAYEAGNSPVTPDCSANILRRWLAFGRAMQSSGSQLPRHLIAETESMLASAPQQEVR